MDGLAEERASRAQVPDPIADRALSFVKEAEAILLRNASLAIAAAGVPKDPDRLVKPERVPRAQRRAAVVKKAKDSSNHSWREFRRGWSCTLCCKIVLRTHQSVLSRLRSKCSAVSSSLASLSAAPARVAIRLPRGFESLPPFDEQYFRFKGWRDPPARFESRGWRGHVLHESHILWQKGGFVFCGMCGRYAEGPPKLLTQECECVLFGRFSLTEAQYTAIMRVRKLLPPRRGTKEWGQRPDFLDPV